MSPADTAELLGLCAAYDSRTVGDSDVLAWAPLMAHVDKADAVLAVQAWYGEHRERITPADIRRLVRAARQERIEKAGPSDPPPEVQAGDHRAYLAWLRSDRRQQATNPDSLPARPVRRLVEATARRLPQVPPG